jgi:hypothetical protein
MTRLRSLLAGVASLAALASTAGAQTNSPTTSTFTASQTVIYGVAFVGGSMQFGSVAKGSAKTVAPDAAGGGRLEMRVEPNLAWTLKITFPAALAGPSSSTAALGNWNGTKNTGSDIASAPSFFVNSDLASGVLTKSLTEGASGAQYVSEFVRFGATVTVPAGAATGAYTASILFEADYN